MYFKYFFFTRVHVDEFLSQSMQWRRPDQKLPDIKRSAVISVKEQFVRKNTAQDHIQFWQNTGLMWLHSWEPLGRYYGFLVSLVRKGHAFLSKPDVCFCISIWMIRISSFLRLFIHQVLQQKQHHTRFSTIYWILVKRVKACQILLLTNSWSSASRLLFFTAVPCVPVSCGVWMCSDVDSVLLRIIINTETNTGKNNCSLNRINLICSSDSHRVSPAAWTKIKSFRGSQVDCCSLLVTWSLTC